MNAKQIAYASKHKEAKRIYDESYREKNLSTLQLKHQLRYREVRLTVLAKTFGITPEHYQRLVKKQNNVCAICKKKETRTPGRGPTPNRPMELAVDHNHKTGAIRALLCFKCNYKVGMVETIWREEGSFKPYIKYLRRYQ